MSKIMFVATHPDDETLGCGGTILKSRLNGDDIFWMIVTNISSSRGDDPTRVEIRRNEIEKVASEYAFNDVFDLNYPTMKLDQIPTSELIGSFSAIIKKLQPNTIYMPFGKDVHSDHKITFNTMISATKSFNNPFIKQLICYETISETEFAAANQENVFCPNRFSDISQHLDKKTEIMKIYKGECGDHPFPRNAANIKALATFRGATAGVKYAEAFKLLKEIC